MRPTHLLIRCLVALGVAMAIINTTDAQAPGDRPAPNPRATRSAVLARHGLIATSQPLASAAGLQVLQEGGNAIDAAITAAAVLSVVEPTMTGIGGDLFAIVWDARTKTLHGLNASGRSAYGATPEALAARGLDELPSNGPLSISVPGAIDGWSELLTRFGSIDLKRAVAPAVRHAREGFAVSEIIAGQWHAAVDVFDDEPTAATTFLPGGRAPRPGEVFSNPHLADSLEIIAAGGRDAFYRGELGRRIVEGLQKRGSWLTPRDFSEHRSDWVEPISTSYRGYDVYRAAAEHTGVCRPRDAEHPRRLRPEIAGPQLRRLSASARRGQAHRVRRPQRAILRDTDFVPARACFKSCCRRTTRALVGKRSIRTGRPPASRRGRRETRRVAHQPTVPGADRAIRSI